MGRDKWTITSYSFTHVNTLKVCMVQKKEKVIYSRTFTQDFYSESLLRSYIYLYFISSYGHFPFNDSERVFICMYFYLLHAYCDFIVLTDFMIYELVRTDLNKRIHQSIYSKASC